MVNEDNAGSRGAGFLHDDLQDTADPGKKVLFPYQLDA